MFEVCKNTNYKAGWTKYSEKVLAVEVKVGDKINCNTITCVTSPAKYVEWGLIKE